MKEKILETFANLGFQLEYAEGIGYLFNYEGMRYLYMYNQEDEEFLSISLPGFYDYNEEKTGEFCALAEKINSTLKYVKAYTLNGSMWLFYERELLSGEDLEEIISRMVRHLEHGLLFARKSIEEIEAGFASQDDETGNTRDEQTDDNE